MAPERIVATKFAGDNPANGVLMTRPLCAFPHITQCSTPLGLLHSGAAAPWASWQELVGADPECSVRAARDRYLADNGFNLESYAAKTFTVQLFGLRLVLPNTRNRRRAIPLHDLHHLATGYGTDLVGEAEIGAWELRCGCNSLVTYYLNGAAALIGLVLAACCGRFGGRGGSGRSTARRLSTMRC